MSEARPKSSPANKNRLAIRVMWQIDKEAVLEGPNLTTQNRASQTLSCHPSENGEGNGHAAWECLGSGLLNELVHKLLVAQLVRQRIQ